MSGQIRRRVLMLAYYFPPLGGGGVQRTLKFAKYLPAEGFDPIVVTTRGVGHRLRDPSLCSEVPPQTIVLRPPELPLHVARWGLESLLRRARLPTGYAQAVGWPDEFAGWAPGALWSTLRAVQRYRPDVIYSTSSPVSSHAVARVASRLSHLPWVADFRDAWTLNPEGGRLFDGLSRRLERRVVEGASRLVCVDETVELLGVPAGDPRCVVIRNGVDPADVQPPDWTPRRDVLRIAHVGMLYGERDAGPVLAAFRNLLSRGALDPEKIELRIVGDARLGPEGDWDGVRISRSGYVDHREALVEMAAADALLLYQPAGWRASTGKVFEYLATGRPILCVAREDNPAARLVTELDAGVCAAPDDQPAIEQAIQGLYDEWSTRGLRPRIAAREEALRRFSRRELAHQLADVLDAACRAS
jgi:glycosyltransferase involved in cell wall biosynthesis